MCIYILKNRLVHQLLAGGGGECLAQRWWWRGSKKSNKPSKPPGVYENSTKTDGLPYIDLKNAKNAVFFT